MSRSRTNKSSSTRKPQPTVESEAGWTTKKTRQQKKNLKKPKQPKKPKKSKQKRGQRKSNQSSNDIEEEPIILEIIKCYPQLRSNKLILKQVISDMNLKSFNPNNHEIKAQILEKISSIKMNKLMNDNIANQQILNKININKQQKQIQQSDTINKQNNDDGNDDDNDDDDEESMEQKDSSESANIEQKSEIIDEDKKSELSEPRDEPQRKKRKRKKRRKKGKLNDENSNNNNNNNESPKQQTPQPQSQPPPPPPPSNDNNNNNNLETKLNNLNLVNIHSTIQQLNEWINKLRERERDNERDNNAFLISFISCSGIEIIIDKIILDLNIQILSDKQNRLLSSNIIAIFDILLCGTHEYHQWLFRKLLNINNKIKDLNINNNDNNVINTVLIQTKNLISAQIRHPLNDNKQMSNKSHEFERPSSLLDSGHTSTDPIVPIFNKLDIELCHIYELYNDLLMHDMNSGNSGNGNGNESNFSKIKSNLSDSINIISHKNHSLEQELFSMKNREEKLNSEQENKLHIIRNTLENQTSEKYRLLSEKRRIENELNKINELLQSTELLIDESNIRQKEINDLFKPKINKLFTAMSDRQFEIAKLSQKSNIFQLLLSITNESYNLLSSFEANKLNTNNSKRYELENNYVNRLYQYLDKLCGAKVMVIDRQNQLEKHIESFKRTNETTNKYYAQNFNIVPQIKQYKQIIKIDIETNRNITKHIYKNINKAQLKISKQLFNKFINHLQIINQKYNKYGTIIDLNKYINQNNNQNNQNNNDSNEKQTQTQINGHNNNNNQKQQQQQLPSNMSSGSQGRKPPITKKNVNVNVNQQQSQQSQSNNNNRRPPRPHYTQYK